MSAQNLPEKPCLICGKMFKPYRVRTLYCCRACQKAAQMEQNREYRRRRARGIKQEYTKVCPVCGETFVTNLSEQKYCGADCKAQVKSGTADVFMGGLNIIKSAEHKEWLQRYRRAPKDRRKLDKHLEQLKEQGISYAEDQKRKSVEMFARIEI